MKNYCDEKNPPTPLYQGGFMEYFLCFFDGFMIK